MEKSGCVGLLAAVLLMVLRVQASTENCVIYVITDQLKSTTEDEFISFTLDPFLLHDVTPRWGTLDFNNPRVQTLAAGLTPSILRYGGTDADWQKFSRVGGDDNLRFKPRGAEQKTAPEIRVVLTPKDVDNLRNLAVQAGGKLLFDLNIQLRYGSQWDPENAIELMQYMIEKGYTKDVDFELGNEPEYPELDIDGTRLAEDFNILWKVLDTLGAFNGSRVVGPDIGIFGPTGSWIQIVSDFVKTVDKRLTAVTMHHYYFAGPGANVSAYTDLRHFETLGPTLEAIRDVVTAAGGADLDVWVGETSDAFNKGTEHVSDRFASGFLWLDKLGTAASLGYKLVARQIFYGGNYPLLNPDLQPNPDYWLSFVFKRLVGRGVLDAEVFTSVTALGYARAYAHCTSPRAKYPDGSVTIYVINLLQTSSISFVLDQSLGDQAVDVYLLSPDGTEGLLSPYVALNGKRLALVDDHTLPTLTPVSQAASKGIVLPPLTFGFIVLPNISATACK